MYTCKKLILDCQVNESHHWEYSLKGSICLLLFLYNGHALRKSTGIPGIQCKEISGHYYLTVWGEEAAPAEGVGLKSWACCISDQCAQRTTSEMLGAPQKPNVSHYSWDRLLTGVGLSALQKSQVRRFVFFLKHLQAPHLYYNSKLEPSIEPGLSRKSSFFQGKCCLNQSKNTISLCFLSFFCGSSWTKIVL